MSRLRVLALVLGCLPAGACAPTAEPASRELIELERLTFVPAARYSLEPFARLVPGWDLSVERSLVVDLFELTRRDLAYYRERPQGPEPASARQPGFFDAERLDWPASLSYDEAVQLAGRRGMRLLTIIEWIHVAVGRRDRYYPWGRDQSSVANTVETGLGHPTRVGTFESGRGLSFGCYDLVGNVWEWVTGRAPGYDDVLSDQLSDDRPLHDVRFDPDQRAWAIGGGFNSERRPTYIWYGLEQRYRFHCRARDRATLSPSIGARMCAEAADYLVEKAPRWGDDARAQARVRSVALRWAGDTATRTELRRLLEAALAEPAAPAALSWMLAGVELSEAQLGDPGS